MRDWGGMMGEFLVMALAVVFAGVSKGGFGSGAAFASASILAVIMPPGAALAIMLPVLMLIDVASLPSYWRKWDWPAARLLLLGGVPGTALGALFYAAANPDVIRVLIGAICLAFVAWQGLGALRPRATARAPLGPGAGLVSGVALGFTSFISHAGGPAAAIYLLGQGLGKTAYQATTVLVFWIINVLKAGIYAGMGIFTPQTLMQSLHLAAFAVLGAWLGIVAHKHMPERAFFALTYVLLTITGSKLIWDGLT